MPFHVYVTLQQRIHLQLAYEVSQHGRIQSDHLVLREDSRIIRFDGGEQLVQPRLDLELAVYAAPLVCARVELDFLGIALVPNLAENQFKQFPKRVRLLESLISRDVVGAPPESK